MSDRLCVFKELLHNAEPALTGNATRTKLPYRGHMMSTYFQYGMAVPGDSFGSDGKSSLGFHDMRSFSG